MLNTYFHVLQPHLATHMHKFYTLTVNFAFVNLLVSHKSRKLLNCSWLFLQLSFPTHFFSLLFTNYSFHLPYAHGTSIWWVHAWGTGCPSCSTVFWWWSHLSGPSAGCWVLLGKSPWGCIAAWSPGGRAAASSQQHFLWCTAWPLLTLPEVIRG